MFTETSSVAILAILVLIFSISEPFFPITNPGLEVKIVTLHFLVGLSIRIFEIPEFLIVSLIYFLILKSWIR